MEIGAFEAKNKLGSLLDRVEQGEEVVITRHGKPVARLVPNGGRSETDHASKALQRIRDRAHTVGHPKSSRASFDWPSLKKERDKGRP